MSESGPESASASLETLPTFPIEENTGDPYPSKSLPELKEGVIMHWQVEHFGERTDNFGLLKRIGKLEYIFKLSRHKGTENYTLSMETKGYGFATTNLDKVTSEELFKIRAGFIESLTNYSQVRVELIQSDPTSTAYSVEEIDDAIEKILLHPENTRSREELASLPAHYRGADLFDIYHKLHGAYYHHTHPNFMNRAQGRSRLFRMMFKKYLKHWEVVEHPGDTSFYLKRK